MRGGNILNKPIVFGCYFSPENKSISINLESQVKSGFIIINELYQIKKDEIEKLGYNVHFSEDNKNKNWIRLKIYKDICNSDDLANYAEELSEIFIKYKKIVEDYILNKQDTWIFQGNPNVFDVDTYLKQNKVITWSIKQERFANKIKINDKIYIYGDQMVKFKVEL